MVAPASRRLSRGHLAFGGAAAMAAYSTIAHRFTRPHLNDRSASSWLSWIFHKNETRMGRLPPCSHRSAPEATVLFSKNSSSWALHPPPSRRRFPSHR